MTEAGFLQVLEQRALEGEADRISMPHTQKFTTLRTCCVLNLVDRAEIHCAHLNPSQALYFLVDFHESTLIAVDGNDLVESPPTLIGNDNNLREVFQEFALNHSSIALRTLPDFTHESFTPQMPNFELYLTKSKSQLSLFSETYSSLDKSPVAVEYDPTQRNWQYYGIPKHVVLNLK